MSVKRWYSIILIPLFFLMSCLWASPLHLSTVTSFHQLQGKSQGQVNLKLSQATIFYAFTLHHPERFVLDLDQTQAKFSPAKLGTFYPWYAHVRLGQNPNHQLRLVFDLLPQVKVKLLPVLTMNKTGQVFQLQFYSSFIQPPKPDLIASKSTLISTEQPVFSPPKTVTASRAKSHWTVVIDPGHGGKDPGAMGPNGIEEKNLVLAIGDKLYRDLSQDPHFTVYMTRNSDYYIGLRQRLAIARHDHADVFIAIHADAYRDEDSMGASVFALSLRGATSEAAKWIADKENYSELGGVSLSGKNDVLRSVLIDLSQTATISASLFLGNDVLSQVGEISPLHKNKVEQAPFVVLKSPDIPSILVETGFISNPREERLLADPVYQSKMAWAIYEGIGQYLLRYGTETV